MPTNRELHSHRWVVFKRLMFATYGDTCHICLHGGARQADHLQSVTEHPELIFSLANVRPAHGAPGNRCPVCFENCNQLRGGYSVERARKLIAERAAGRDSRRQRAVKRYGEPAKPEPQEPPRETGREW